MLVADLGYSDFLGRLAIGRTHNREINANDTLVRIDAEGRQKPLRVSRLQVYQGLSMVEAKRAEAGDVVVLAGIDEVHIGDTICTVQHPKAMRRITVDEPTVSMVIGRNTSPFAGKEGSFVQSSKIGERLFKETMRNVSLQVEETENRDAYLVKGRGEFQMAILIETMRREGFEMEVGRPHVIYRRGDAGSLLEPIERLFIDCGDTYVGVVTEKLSLRKARLVNMVNHSSGRVRMEFSAPARALIGFRDELLTDTRGTGIMNAQLDGYEEYRGEFVTRQTGSLVADRQGESVPYALFNLEPRGVLFIGAGEPVYEGMIIGEHNRDNDLDVNPCKTKKLTNVRAAARDENVILTPPHTMTLEAALSFIRDDELVEVTPKSLRMRKSVLQANQRKRQKEPVAE
jgi:GTP-binding protein